MKAGIRQSMAGATLLLAAMALGIARTAQAQQAAIGGQVVDAGDTSPLEAARVVLTGTSQIETTNREGRFLFRNVAPGTHAVRVLRVGYRPVTDSVTVAPGETATLNFSLAPAAVQLDELVTTATGQQRKLEIGNAVTTIDAAKVAEQAPITEFANLLSGPRRRRAGAQEQRHHRHRHSNPDSRLQQHLALQRAAVLSRRHPAGEATRLRARSTSAGSAPASARVPRASTTSIPTTSRTSRS